VPAWLVDLFGCYGYAVVFVGVFLENTGLPVPGETALLAGAALSRSGTLFLPWVVLIATAGAILGDNLGFFIGRRGGRALVERFGARVGLSEARFAQFDRFFDTHGAKTVFIARFVTGLRVVGAVLAGTSGLPWGRFLFYNASGAVAWAGTFGAVGYLLAYSWATLEEWMGRSGLILLAALAVILGGMLMRRRRLSTVTRVP
jgi:membrane protein DedA with SNARE-associated domain